MAEIAATDGFDFVVKLDQSTIDALTSTDKTVNVNTDTAQQNISNLTSSIENIPDGETTVDANTASASEKLYNIGAKIDEVSGMVAHPSVVLSDNASSPLSSIQSML